MAENDLLTVEHFTAHVGDSFEIDIEGSEPYRLELTEAQGTSGDSDARQPFSLIFRGSSARGYLEQRVYRLRHASLEPLDLFLVPLGPDKGGDGMLYEAAFS